MARRLLIRAALAGALLIAIAGAVLTACNAGSPRACTVSCSVDGECPADTTCGTDGYCHAAGEPTDSCAEGGGGDATDDGGDGSGDGSDGSDGSDGADDGSDGSDGADDGGDGPEVCDPCDPVEQCGCLEGEACHVGRDRPEPTCTTAGTGAEETPCAFDEECAAGFSCHIEPGLPGHCQAYCNRDADCGGGVSLCNRPIGGTDTRTCTSDCDPLDEAACALFEKCTLDQGAGGRWDARCLEHGGALDFETCFEQYDCAPGYICAESDPDFGVCEFMCIVGTSCGSTICAGYFPAVELGGVEYGFCPF